MISGNCRSTLTLGQLHSFTRRSRKSFLTVNYKRQGLTGFSKLLELAATDTGKFPIIVNSYVRERVAELAADSIRLERLMIRS